MRTCRYCAEEVSAADEVCPHCGETLAAGSTRSHGRMDPEILLREYEELTARRSRFKRRAIVTGTLATCCTLVSVAVMVNAKSSPETTARIFGNILIFAALGSCCVMCGAIAIYKGRSAVWGLAGLTGVFSILLVAALKDAHEERILELKLALSMLNQPVR